jgi:hypothetical protein
MNTREINKYVDRLRNLIRVANKFKRENIGFDMSTFANGFYEAISHGLVKTAEEGLNKPECGTTVCLAGRAGLDPYFIKRGFKTDLIDRMVHSNKNRLTWSLHEFFGITKEDMALIFYSHNIYDQRDSRKIDKTATLNRIIKDIKLVADIRFGVKL